MSDPLILWAFAAAAVAIVIVPGADMAIILTSALLRATYHLYQGFGAFIGNFVMGIVFGWIYTRTGRVLPLVIGHTVIDAVIFVGYPWAASAFPELLGLPA